MLSFAAQPLAAQERPDQERLRSESQQLSDKARDLKVQAERLDAQAEQLARQVRQLEQRGRPEGPMPGDRRSEQPGDRNRPPEPGRDGDQNRPGSDRPSQQPPDRAQRFQERGPGNGQNPGNRGPEFDNQDRRSEQGAPGPGRMDRGDQLGRPDARPDFAMRKFHIREAINHLHAAGLHAQADRLEQRLAEASQRLPDGPPRRGPKQGNNPPGPGPGPGPGPDGPRENQTPRDR